VVRGTALRGTRPRNRRELILAAAADLDGDGQPDFVIDVEGQVFVLLSTLAKPGLNAPSAELWAGHAGC